MKMRIFVSIIAVLFVCSCANDQTTILANSALNIVDQYLDCKLTRDETNEKLQELFDRIDKLYEDNNDTNTLLLGSAILNVKCSISLGDSDNDIIELRNTLAEYLNKSKR
jgi:hypothetical protein